MLIVVAARVIDPTCKSYVDAGSETVATSINHKSLSTFALAMVPAVACLPQVVVNL